jgi:uncharacterized protein
VPEIPTLPMFVTLAGSHAHGTARADSDVDLRGVCVAPLSVRVSYRRSFEQTEGPPAQVLGSELWQNVASRLRAHGSAHRGLDAKVEIVVFDVAKFVRLAAEANPNALEILFADEADWLHATEAWAPLHDRRGSFLSKKVQQTYLGYGLAQLKRIRTHRAWLLDPPKTRPARPDFGLPEQSTLSRDDRTRIELAVAEKLRSWGIDELDMPASTRVALSERLRGFWADRLVAPDEDPGAPAVDERLEIAAATSLGLSRELVRSLAAERRYRSALKHWEAYARWKEERSPARAALEARFGYDTKHAAHLVRLMRTGLELLERGELRVRRPDAAELGAIRDGALRYEEVVAEAERLRTRMQHAAARSALPLDVDHEALDALLFELIERFSPSLQGNGTRAI